MTTPDGVVAFAQTLMRNRSPPLLRGSVEREVGFGGIAKPPPEAREDMFHYRVPGTAATSSLLPNSCQLLRR